MFSCPPAPQRAKRESDEVDIEVPRSQLDVADLVR